VNAVGQGRGTGELDLSVLRERPARPVSSGTRTNERRHQLTKRVSGRVNNSLPALTNSPRRRWQGGSVSLAGFTLLAGSQRGCLARA
jgi:hypothetical protein